VNKCRSVNGEIKIISKNTVVNDGLFILSI